MFCKATLTLQWTDERGFAQETLTLHWTDECGLHSIYQHYTGLINVSGLPGTFSCTGNTDITLD